MTLSLDTRMEATLHAAYEKDAPWHPYGTIQAGRGIPRLCG